jgi:hypothetical protein
MNSRRTCGFCLRLRQKRDNHRTQGVIVSNIDFTALTEGTGNLE